MGEERLLESNPTRSYKMDRKSPVATELRNAVNEKLLDFLGNYSDDVLAEYIVVLVCNGKDQNQARHDLEAFLGDDSGEFVAWLWDHLAKENYISRTSTDSSSFKAEATSSHEVMDQKSSDHPGRHAHSDRMSDIPLPKDGGFDPSYRSRSSHCSNVVDIPESLERCCSSINGSLTGGNNERFQNHVDELNPVRLHAEPVVANKHIGAPFQTRTTKQFSSVVRCPAEISLADDQLHNEYQHQKIAKIDSGELHHQPLPVPRGEQPARGLRSVITEDPESRPLPTRNSPKLRVQSAGVDSASYQISRPRGNVWDRLGKPCNEDDTDMRGKNNLHANSLIKRNLPEPQGEELQNTRAAWFKQHARFSDNSVGESVGVNIVPEDHPNAYRNLENSSSNIVDCFRLSNSKRKRLYSECSGGNVAASFSGRKENHLQVKETPTKSQDSLPLKFNKMQSLDNAVSEAKGSTTLYSESHHNAVISARVQPSQADKVGSVISDGVLRNSQEDKVSSPQSNKTASVRPQARRLVPKNSQSPSKSVPPSKAEHLSANRKPMKEEVLDVKSKLCQVETDMLKLRKLAELRNEANPGSLAGPAVQHLVLPNSQLCVQNHSEEDLESRTVLVTNVHYAATREDLLSHFSKCGAVTKVVMLTDTITAQPKGAAYIVFTNKDSVDKAVSLSGMSFFSRILKVMKKADMPPDFLVPPPSPAKLVHPFYPQPFWKGSGHYSSPHLQWRRENSATKDNSASATPNGLESSATGE